MIPDELAKEMLRNISLQGSTLEENRTANTIIGSHDNLSHIASIQSGTMKLLKSVEKKFQMLLGCPEGLKVLNYYEIRCCLCKKAITYPCWYYKIEYAVNHFHYFVCLNSDSVNANCYRRIV